MSATSKESKKSKMAVAPLSEEARLVMDELRQRVIWRHETRETLTAIIKDGAPKLANSKVTKDQVSRVMKNELRDLLNDLGIIDVVLRRKFGQEYKYKALSDRPNLNRHRVVSINPVVQSPGIFMPKIEKVLAPAENGPISSRLPALPLKFVEVKPNLLVSNNLSPLPNTSDMISHFMATSFVDGRSFGKSYTSGVIEESGIGGRSKYTGQDNSESPGRALEHIKRPLLGKVTINQNIPDSASVSIGGNITFAGGCRGSQVEAAGSNRLCCARFTFVHACHRLVQI